MEQINDIEKLEYSPQVGVLDTISLKERISWGRKRAEYLGEECIGEVYLKRRYYFINVTKEDETIFSIRQHPSSLKKILIKKRALNRTLNNIPDIVDYTASLEFKKEKYDNYKIHKQVYLSTNGYIQVLEQLGGHIIYYSESLLDRIKNFFRKIWKEESEKFKSFTIWQKIFGKYYLGALLIPILIYLLWILIF